MVIVDLLVWWYGRGWRARASALMARLGGTVDYFSIDLLIRTLFSPFRQIAAGKVQGPIGVKMRAFFDRLVSRIIGGIVRFIVMVIGSVTIVSQFAISVALLIGWALLPFFPFVAVVFYTSGWLPWTL